MNKFFGSLPLLTLFVLSGTALSQERFCFRNPQRIIGDARVSISPLLKWWSVYESALRRSGSGSQTNREALLKARPLSSWDHIEGSWVEDFGGTWIVDATIELIPGKTVHKRILLFHPPEDEKKLFDDLTAKLKWLQGVESQSIAASSSNDQLVRENNSRVSTLDMIGNSSGFMRAQVGPQLQAYDHASSIAIARSQIFMARARSASDEIPKIQLGLASMPTGKEYRIDFFALRTGQIYNGLPVYELGLFVK